MTKLMNDDRECAKQVNALFEAARVQRNGPRFEREVEFHPKVYVFGHYDSRGGATAVFAPNVIKAIEKYVGSCGWVGEDEEGNLITDDNSINVAYEDLLSQGMFQMVVCDEPLDDKSELLVEYDDQGYKAALVEHRWLDTYGGNKWSDWESSQMVVLWKGSLPDTESLIQSSPSVYEPDISEEERARRQKFRDDILVQEERDYVKDAPPFVPPASLLMTQYRLVRWQPGEDACGLIQVA